MFALYFGKVVAENKLQVWDHFNAEAQRRGEAQRGLACVRMR